MNAVGIDVSKDKSTIAVMQPLGVVVAAPYDVLHTEGELKKLAAFLKSLPGETRVLMEYTGHYYEPVARTLHEAGIFVSVTNAILVHDYGTNSLRKVKTDKKDAIKLATMALDRWTELREYIPTDETRQNLKLCNRQYNQYNKLKVMMKNNLIALLDQSFPGVNKLFHSPPRKRDGHEKWIDFSLQFWHRDCVCSISEKAFTEKYSRWCSKHGYHFRSEKASAIYAYAAKSVATLAKCDTTKLIVTQAIRQLQNIEETLATLRSEMQKMASSLPEYKAVMSIYGVGEVLGPQLIAEIGDVSRFKSRKSLIAFAGIDPPPNQSGQVDVKSRSISKLGSAYLRKTLFQVISIILQNSPPDDPVFTYLDKKRSEGKPYKVYMIATANKLLRIYYARAMLSMKQPPVTADVN